MRLHQEFVGGNIEIVEQNGNTFVLQNQLRDTIGDWFYWAFCVEGAENQTYTFQFGPKRIGYFGPAVSHDLINWTWLESNEGDSFTYHFGENEHRVYFAHSMLYHPDRFITFAKRCGLEIQEFCKGYKGSSVPCITFGSGSKRVILTARHHACESTGNYVLEGVLEELLTNPNTDLKVLCVPFVDYEGVIRGDQGKARAPHDHNRDYSEEIEAIYPECRALKEYAKTNGCHFGFDFHSPGHKGKEHDNVFIVQNFRHLEQFIAFGELFEEEITSDALQYKQKNDYPPEHGWNTAGTMFAHYMNSREENHLAFALETPYFGLTENQVTAEKMIEMGRCFAKAFRRYLKREAIQYIANAGVVLQTESGQIGIDCLAKDEQDLYPHITDDVRENLYQQIASERMNTLIFTHEHSDHFREEWVKEAWDKNSSLQIFSTKKVAERLEQKGIKHENLHTVKDGECVKVGETEITFIYTLHEGDVYANVQNLTLLIKTGTKTLVMTGDAMPCKELFQRISKWSCEVDWLVVPFPYVARRVVRNMIGENIKVANILACHLPKADKDQFGWIQSAKKMCESATDGLPFPIFASTTGEVIVLDKVLDK